MSQQQPNTPDREKQRQDLSAQTLLEQMGGIAGVIYSAVPVIVFVVVVSATSLIPAIWSAVGSAVLILIVRLVRKEPVQPAISGVFGVAIAAFIAYKTGSAKGYFALGIWYSVALGVAFLISIVARWPLAGVIWSYLNGLGMGWRKDKIIRRYYDLATGVWILVFAARFVVQQWLYNQDEVGWLGVARIAMGLPLTGLAALATIWAVRMADKRSKATAAGEEDSTASPVNGAVVQTVDGTAAAERTEAGHTPAADGPADTARAAECTASQNTAMESTARQNTAGENTAVESAARSGAERVPDVGLDARHRDEQ